MVLNVLDLALLGLDLSLALIDFILEVGLGLLLLLRGHLVKLSVSLELLIDAGILLLNHVDFAV